MKHNVKQSVNNITCNFHRRTFNCFAFALIFYNGLAGVLAAVLRGVLSLAFNLLLFLRLDRLILMRGFEKFDKGGANHILKVLNSQWGGGDLQ